MFMFGIFKICFSACNYSHFKNKNVLKSKTKKGAHIYTHIYFIDNLLGEKWLGVFVLIIQRGIERDYKRVFYFV